MRIERRALASALALAGAFAGLLPVPGAAIAQDIQPRDIRVVATIKPIHALLAAVMGDAGTATLLIDGAGSPHTYTLKPSDARALNRATIVVRVSDNLEPFMGKILRSLPASVTVVTLESIVGMRLLPMRSGGTFEADAHAGHGKGGGHASHQPASAAAMDGHIWLDVDNAKRIAAHLATVLSAAAPAHAARYAANAAALATRLDALAAEIGQTLEPVRGRPYVVFHDAYQYLEQRHGLPAAGAVTVSPDVQPGARRLRELRAKVASLGAVCVFAEPQFEPKLVATVIEGTAARTGILDPLGAGLAAGPELYPALMRNLAAALVACLARASEVPSQPARK